MEGLRREEGIVEQMVKCMLQGSQLTDAFLKIMIEKKISNVSLFIYNYYSAVNFRKNDLNIN